MLIINHTQQIDMTFLSTLSHYQQYFQTVGDMISNQFINSAFLIYTLTELPPWSILHINSLLIYKIPIFPMNETPVSLAVSSPLIDMKSMMTELVVFLGAC